MRKEQIQQTPIHHDMKNIFATIIASLIVGMVVFAILYWLFNLSKSESAVGAISGILGGLLAPYSVSVFKRAKQKGTHSTNSNTP